MERYPAGGGPGTAVLVRYGPDGAREWSLDLVTGGFPLKLTAMPGGDAVVAVCPQSTCTMDDGSARIRLIRVTPGGARRWGEDLEISGDDVLSLDSDARGRVLAIVAFWDVEIANIAHSVALIVDDGGAIAPEIMLDVDWPRGEFGGPSGDFAVAGQDRATSKPVIERVGSDGSLRWRKLLDTTAGAADRVAFAEDGSIAIAGWFRDELQWAGVDHRLPQGAASGFLLVGGGDGSEQWGVEDFELRTYANMGRALRFGTDNELIVHSTYSGKGLSYVHALSRDGARLWRYSFRGIYGTWVESVSVGRDGRVLVGAKGSGDAPFTGLPYGSDDWFVAVLAP